LFVVIFISITAMFDTAGNNLSLQDRMKVACLNYAVSTGLDEDGMTALFKYAAGMIRQAKNIDEVTSMPKEAFLDPIALAKTLGLLGAAGLVGGGLLTAGVGNVLGRTASDIVAGQTPSGDELRTVDEIAAYDRNTDEVLTRIKERRAKDALRSKPSVRRMF
jgi:hypothetical protein